MSKGFSTLELVTIITCASIAIHGASKDGPVNLASITGQISHAYGHSSTFDPSKHFWQVGNSLEKINNS